MEPSAEGNRGQRLNPPGRTPPMVDAARKDAAAE